MERLSLFIWLSVFMPISLTAWGGQPEGDLNKDTIHRKVDTAVKRQIMTTMDSALLEWQVSNSYLTDDNYPSEKRKKNPEFSDSFFKANLEVLNKKSPIDYTYNKWVKAFVDLYANKRRDKVEQMLGLSHYYFPILETYLDKAELPLRLKYLPIIESALNPTAVSPAGAKGLWQFMYPTAKQYGLEITTYVDERKSVQASTKAAVNYLKDLYKIYEDWLMVIAAYNCGPGNVNKAIRRSGYSDQFWKIYPYLPRETRGYVPAFIAVSHVFENHRVHNLFPRKAKFPEATDTVMVGKKLHFKALAKAMDLDMEALRKLNPEYKKGVIPAIDKPRPLILPFKSSLAFCSNVDRIYAIQDTLLDKNEGNTEEDNQEPAYTRLYYTVKSGDNLGYIAEWYDCRASDLRRWNRLRGNTIHVGDRLKILVPSAKAEKYKKINQLSFNQKQRLARSGQIQGWGKKIDGDKYVYYQVTYGDTLWGIAQKFPDVSVSQLKSLNNINNNSRIDPGEKIKLRKKG